MNLTYCTQDVVNFTMRYSKKEAFLFSYFPGFANHRETGYRLLDDRQTIFVVSRLDLFPAYQDNGDVIAIVKLFSKTSYFSPLTLFSRDGEIFREKRS